jgi:hypothetical protein
VSVLVIRLPNVREVFRYLRIIVGVLIIAIFLHQVRSDLVSCIRGLLPDPIACNQPEVVLPHVDNDGPALGPVSDKAPFAVVASATTATPCLNPGPSQRPR